MAVEKRIYVEIFCENYYQKHCDIFDTSIQGLKNCQNVREARREAKEYGWTIKNGDDYCPNCSKNK